MRFSRMKTKIGKTELIIGSMIIVVWLFYLFFPKKVGNDFEEICCDDKCFQIELAITPEERWRWLMFRENLAENAGMLFVFEKEDFYSFWMKNTLIPLDMIWLDENLKIVDILSAEPCKTENCPSYIPRGKAKYVLEVNQGLIWKTAQNCAVRYL